MVINTTIETVGIRTNRILNCPSMQTTGFERKISPIPKILTTAIIIIKDLENMKYTRKSTIRADYCVSKK